MTHAQFEQLYHKYVALQKDDIVIVAGSVPNSIPSDAYAQIAQITEKTGAQLVVDAEKILLKQYYHIDHYLLNQTKMN